VADDRETQQREPLRRDRSMMVNSPLRWAVILVFLLAGIVVLSKGFDTSSGAAPGGGRTPTTPAATSPSSTPRHSPSARPPSLTGITVAIYNSTKTTGLANDQRQQLVSAGWDVASIGNETTAFATTTIYYVSGAKAQAEYLKSSQYPHAVVQPAPPAFRDAKISVVLGTDFTSTP
jgi:hypothetical protein